MHARISPSLLSGTFLVGMSTLALAGCNGPENVNQDQFTFTEQTANQANKLAQRAESGSTRSSASGSGVPYLEALPGGSGSGSTASGDSVVLDLSQVATYQSIRTGVRSAGKNQYTVSNAFVNVRKTPDIHSENLAKLNFGDSLAVLGFPNALWAQVKTTSGTQGYVALQYITRMVGDDTADAERRQYDGQYFVSFKFVNMRKTPDQKAEKLAEIPANSILIPSEIKDSWAKVKWNNQEGYVSRGYLSPFQPPLVVRQNTYDLPVLLYHISPGQESAVLTALGQHVVQIKAQGYTFITLADFRDLLLAQQKKDVRMPAKRVVVAVTGITPQNVRQVSDALNAATINATLFIETRNVGLSGITEKTLHTLIANGFDIESGTHTGDDMRALTNAQVDLELKQSRKILEDMTQRTVFAVAYPQGGTNQRLEDLASRDGYLLGVSSASGISFNRDQLLSMPSVEIFPSMTGDDVLKLLKP